ncbi:LacI family DNA-binding transcriptional regulator [soil metagenome]
MATIRQVAAHAGVSIGTVSKVLNGLDEKVDPVAKERIWASIRELRYRPPAFEPNQKAAVSQNLGLIVPDLTENPLQRHGYVQQLLNGALEVSAFRGWSVTIFADNMWDDVGNAVRRKYDGRCDGLIVVAPQPDRDLVPSLRQRGAPIVQIGTTAWLDDVSSVDIDNVEAGRLVARHFLGLGHRRLGFLTDHREQVSSVERFQGYQEVAGGKAVRLVMERDESPSDLIRRFLALGKGRPTALMGWHDGILLPLFAALEAEGLSVPCDLSLAGVDRSSEVREMGIDLTAVENPIDDLGRRAAAMAIDRALDHSLPQEIVKLPPMLTVGSTTGPL